MKARIAVAMTLSGLALIAAESNPTAHGEEDPLSSIRNLQIGVNTLPCDLECKNGGKCEYIPGSMDDLRKYAQSGILVQYCKCPNGFGGVGCEIPVEACLAGVDSWGKIDPRTGESMPTTYTCALSGKPCDVLPNGSLTCACHVADAVDHTLAGTACRRWNTEYCTGSLDGSNDGSLYLCANGGKCESDFIAAQIAPGDLAVNQQYADAGCVCNKHFYGPHCEFLEFDESHNIAMQKQKKGMQTWQDDKASGGKKGLIFALLAAGMGVILLVMYRSRSRKARSAAPAAEGVFKDSDQLEFTDAALPPGGQDLYGDAVMSRLHDVDLQDDVPFQAPAAATPSIAIASSSSEEEESDGSNSGEEPDEENAPAAPMATAKGEATHHFFT